MNADFVYGVFLGSTLVAGLASFLVLHPSNYATCRTCGAKVRKPFLAEHYIECSRRCRWK